MDLTQLELAPRVKGALRRAGFTDTQRIHAATDEELLGIRDIGQRALKELRTHPIILAEAGADQLLLAEMERVKVEADEKVRAALSAADEKVRAALSAADGKVRTAEEGLRQKTVEAKEKLEEAQELGRKAQNELAQANRRAKGVSRLEPLLEGADLIREYHQLCIKKWEWPSVRPFSVTFSLGGSGEYWYVKAVTEGTESNKAAMLQMLLEHPEYLLQLHEIAVEAAGVAKRLEEVSKQLSLLIKPIELFKIWARVEQVYAEEREASQEEEPQA